MEIIRWQVDERNITHMLIGGMAADGHYRLARVSIQIDDPYQWLADHPEVQALIDAGEYSAFYETKLDFDALADQADGEIDWLEATIPAIDTMTAQQVRDVVKRLARENLQMIKAWRYILRRLG